MLSRNAVSFTARSLHDRGTKKLYACPAGDDENLVLEFECPKDSFNLNAVGPVVVHTHCAVNTNSGEETWYAFKSWETLEFFRTLMLVDRMSPKSAFKVLNSTPWEKISDLIRTNDREGFKKLKGIPEKTANDIVALVFAGIASPVNIFELNGDAVAALQALGWKVEVAKKAVAAAQAKTKSNSTEELIKACLKKNSP